MASKYLSKVFPIKTKKQIEKMESFIDSLGNRYIDDYEIATNTVKVLYLRSL